MIKKLTSKTTLSEIRRMLCEDGYEFLVGGGGNSDRAAEIKRAGMTGCLLWTRKRLTTTDGSHIDARQLDGPRRQEHNQFTVNYKD